MLLAAPRAVLAAPMADIWFATDYEFELGVDACEFESTPDLCQRNGSTNVWECKAERLAGGGTGAIMYMVRNKTSPDICDGYEYCAFGSIKTGTSSESPFYCAWDGDDMDEMSLSGTVYEDYLYFHHDQQGSLFNMEDHSGVDKVTGFIYGLSGNDRVHGSHYDADAVYADVLYGGGDDDIIWGHAGSDLINAGSGDGDDRISLGDGNDSADGIEGADTICGDDGDDVIEGASGNDVLWGGADSDSNDGGPGTDLCNAETESACDGLQASRPTACPAVTEPSPAG